MSYLDNDAARLPGNVLHRQEENLDKQGPSLPASVEGFAKEVLNRLETESPGTKQVFYGGFLERQRK